MHSPSTSAPQTVLIVAAALRIKKMKKKIPTEKKASLFEAVRKKTRITTGAGSESRRTTCHNVGLNTEATSNEDDAAQQNRDEDGSELVCSYFLRYSGKKKFSESSVVEIKSLKFKLVQVLRLAASFLSRGHALHAAVTLC